jgi:hypothetical protein
MSYMHKIQKDKGAEPDEFEASVAQVRLGTAAAGVAGANGIAAAQLPGQGRTWVGARVLGRRTYTSGPPVIQGSSERAR